MCGHERCSGLLSLQIPDRLLILATLRCDDCGAALGEMKGISAEASATQMRGLPLPDRV